MSIRRNQIARIQNEINFFCIWFQAIFQTEFNDMIIIHFIEPLQTEQHLNNFVFSLKWKSFNFQMVNFAHVKHDIDFFC